MGSWAILGPAFVLGWVGVVEARTQTAACGSESSARTKIVSDTSTQPQRWSAMTICAGVCLSLAIVFLLHVTAVMAQDKRIALLIGNQAYDPTVGVLRNPHNDIRLVGAALAKQGFTVLPSVKDATRSQILHAIRDLVRRLNVVGPGAIGFIYYSGHGAAEKDTNINYVIPIDSKQPGTTEFWDESLKLDDILQYLDWARAAAKFVVFDACRTELQLPIKDTSKGLLPVAEQRGMFIAYSTAPGHSASDTGTSSGPYAAALAGELSKPGLDHLNLFQNVKETVMAATGGGQQPWESNGLARRIYLTGEPPSVSQLVEQNFWSVVKNSENPSVLQTYLDRYPNGNFANVAHASIEQRMQEIRAKQAQIEAEERRVEEERKVLEAKRLEEAKKAAALELAEVKRSEAARRAKEKQLAEQLTQALEEARSARAAAQAADERSKAALRDSERARIAAEEMRRAQAAAALAEEQRNTAIKEAEETKRALDAARANLALALAAGSTDQHNTAANDAEKVRLATETAQAAQRATEAAELQKQTALKEAEQARAALDKLKSAQLATAPQQLATLSPSQGPPPGDTRPGQLSRYTALNPDDFAKEMQRQLGRVGCYPGDIDGKWGEKAKAALRKFIKFAKVAIGADQPSPEALDIISAQRVRICPLECNEGEHAVADKCVPKPKISPERSPPEKKPQRAASASILTGGYQTCGRKGCQWVPKGCHTEQGGGHHLGGRVVCPGQVRERGF
jgi:Caspase domain